MEKFHGISSYEDKLLGVIRPKFEFNKSDYESELDKLDSQIKETYISKLERISQYFQGKNLSVNEIMSVTNDLCDICNILPYKQTTKLMIICLNLSIRAALSGNIKAMHNIVNVPYIPFKEDISKIIIVDGIKDFDYHKMKKTLSKELEKNESEEAFVETIIKMKKKAKSKREALKTLPLVKFLPNTVTLVSMCFGLTAIQLAHNEEWKCAVLSMVMSAFLDMFDGKIARFLNQSSTIGLELDSLSDLVCFGVAPSIVLYSLAMEQVGKIGWGICLFYTVCCALRLARFNVSHSNVKQITDLDIKYFVGIPAPAGAAVALFPLFIYLGTGKYAFIQPISIGFFLLCAGFLMISTIHTFSSKIVVINKSNLWIAFVLITIIVVCLALKFWITSIILISFYILAIPLGSCAYSVSLKASKLKE